MSKFKRVKENGVVKLSKKNDNEIIIGAIEEIQQALEKEGKKIINKIKKK